MTFKFGIKFFSPKRGTYATDLNLSEVAIGEGVTSVRFNSVKVDCLSSIKIMSNSEEIDINP